MVRSWSPSAARLTGRPFEEVIGRSLPFAIPPPGQVVAQHAKLKDAKAGAKMKKYWGEALDRLKKEIE